MKKTILLAVALFAVSATAFGAMNIEKRFRGGVAVGALAIGDTEITASGTELNEYSLTLDIADLSAEATYYVVAPHAGTISKIYSVIDGAVGTADATITCNIGATPITDGAITITQSGSAAGDVDSATPSAANTITAGAALNCVAAGGGAGGTPRAHVVFVITR